MDDLPKSYSLAAGRSRLELRPDSLTFAAPLRGLSERRIELSDLRHFCIDPVQVASLKAKLLLDFDADLVLSWQEAGAVRHARIAVKSDAPDLRSLLGCLEEMCPSSSLVHLPVREALRVMKVPSRDRAVVLVLGVVGLGAILVVGIIVWMLRTA